MRRVALTPKRYLELDVMKAVAIVAVVLIHSIRPFFSPDMPPLEKVISQITRFAVPAFLSVSGFLYYSAAPIPLVTIGRRLRRILVPYVCMSLLAYAYVRLCPWRTATDSFVEGLLLGGIFGPYYYIFVLTEFVAATWLLSRLPRTAVHALFLLAALSAVLAELYWWLPHDLFWIARTPRKWAVWFLLGWLAAAHRDWLLDVTARRRVRILLAWIAVTVGWLWLSGAGEHGDASARVAGLAMIAVHLVALFTVARGVQRLPRPIVLLSDWTYPIYLLHPFFVYAVADFVPALAGVPSPASALSCWLAGLVGAVTTTFLARAVLGDYSRDIIGA